MSTPSVRRRLGGVRFDLVAAIGGLVLAVGLFPLRFLASQIYIETVPVVLGLACGLYLLASLTGEKDVPGLPTLPRRVHDVLAPLVFVGLAGLVVAATVAGERSIVFYELAGAVGTLVFAQIAFAGDQSFRRTLVLVQIVLLAFVVRFAALYTTPGLIGIDSWTHITQLAHAIEVQQSLGAISGNKHFTSPLYHLLVVASSLLYDVSLRNALYLSLGVVMPLTALLVFTTANLLVNERWSALAALLFSLGDYVIEWGIHLIPTSMGLALFLGVLYWLVRLMRSEGTPLGYAMLTGFSVAVILTHQVSSFIMLVVLGAAVVSYLFARSSLFSPSGTRAAIRRATDPVNLTGLVVFDAGLITFLWSFTPYNGGTFLLTILSYLEKTIASSAGVLDLAGPSSAGGAAASAAPTLTDTLFTYTNTTGFLLLLFGTFVGCLYVVNRYRARQSVLLLLVSAAIMLVFVLGLPLFGIRNFIPQRWFAFLYAPLAILTVIGLRFFAQTLDRRVFALCLALFALTYPSVMVMSAHGTIDNPVFEDHAAELRYNEQELQAADTIGRMTGSPSAENIRPDQVLYTDHPYQTMFSRTGSYPADTARINDSEPTSADVTVYRRADSTEATYFLNSRGYGEIRNVPRERVCRPQQAVLYTNDAVQMCVSSSASGT
ncbi:MAG: hypothetical protein ABEJ40_01700 [Haloarculaceae archaeon]